MGMTFRRAILWPAFICCLLLTPGAAGATSVLDYQVTYRGVFSAGTDLPIADLRLDSRRHAGAPGILETRIEASSAAYPLVESLFPIRYRFRNWTTPQAGAALIGFETYERTRKLRHRLYLRDGSKLGVRRFDVVAGTGDEAIAQLEAGVSPMAPALDGSLLDRLGLLQRVRQEPLHEQAVYRFDVTNGRERLRYRVKVEADQLLYLDGVAVPAWKLRFDGLETGKDGRPVPAHRPLYLWLSQSSGRIPLRVDSRHRIGLFRIQLNDRATLERLMNPGE